MGKKIAVKAHKTGGGVVVGACDAHLLGKKLKDGKLVLDISERFFFERHAGEEELIAMVDECITANLVGEAATGAYCKKNPAAKGGIKKIGGVPHLQVFNL